MRPQTAMAALFLLMIGSSAVFLGKGRYGNAPTMSTEQATAIERDRSVTATATAIAAAAPESPAPPPMASAPVIANAKRSESADMVALAEGRPSPIAPAAKAGIADEELGSAAKRGAGGAEAKQAADKDSLWSANSAYRAQNYSEATRLYDQSAKQGDLEAELGAARSVRDGTGCPSAVSRYDALASHAPGTTQANAAIFEAAKCYESFGDYDAAATRFKKLGGTPYAAQAKAEIDKMNTMVKAKGGSVTGGAAAAPKAAAPARMEAAPSKKLAPASAGSMD